MSIIRSLPMMMSTINQAHNGLLVTLRMTERSSAFGFPLRQFVLTPNSAVDIGRASKDSKKNLMADVDNALFDCAVMSREHARLSITGGDRPLIYLTDCGSTHGTFVNDDRLSISQPRRLHAGDTLRFGGSIQCNESVYRGCTMRITFSQSRPTYALEYSTEASPESLQLEPTAETRTEVSDTYADAGDDAHDMLSAIRGDGEGDLAEVYEISAAEPVSPRPRFSEILHGIGNNESLKVVHETISDIGDDNEDVVSQKSADDLSNDYLDEQEIQELSSVDSEDEDEEDTGNYSPVVWDVSPTPEEEQSAVEALIDETVPEHAFTETSGSSKPAAGPWTAFAAAQQSQLGGTALVDTSVGGSMDNVLSVHEQVTLNKQAATENTKSTETTLPAVVKPSSLDKIKIPALLQDKTTTSHKRKADEVDESGPEVPASDMLDVNPGDTATPQMTKTVANTATAAADLQRPKKKLRRTLVTGLQMAGCAVAGSVATVGFLLSPLAASLAQQ